MSTQLPTTYSLPMRSRFELLEIHAEKTGKNIDDKEIRETFITSLSRNDKKEIIRFGIEKPLSEIVTHLERINSPSDSTKYYFGEIVQGNDSILLFYAKLKKYNKILNLDVCTLKRNFLLGLNSENQIEAQRCGIDLPLEELVSRLDMLEKLN
jgi:hypothetical protein